MRAVAYVRCSTEEQHSSGLGLDAQRRTIEQACEQRGWTIVATQSDIASGSRKDRPGLSQALRRLDEGSADVVVVSRLDRLSRSVSHFASMLERYPSALVPLDLGVEPGSIAGTFTLHVVSAASEMERRLIGARTREALEAARERGTTLGRPREVPAVVAFQIRELHRSTVSFAEVARIFNRMGVRPPRGKQWYPDSIRRVVRQVA